MSSSQSDFEREIPLEPPSYRIQFGDAHIVRFRVEGPWVAMEVVGAYGEKQANSLLFYNLETFELREAGPCAISEDPYRCSTYKLARAGSGHFLYTRPLEQHCFGPYETVLYDPALDSSWVLRPPENSSISSERPLPGFSDGKWFAYQVTRYEGVGENRTLAEPSGYYVQPIAGPWAARLSDIHPNLPIVHTGAGSQEGVRFDSGHAYYFAGNATHGDLIQLNLTTLSFQVLISNQSSPRGINEVSLPWIVWSGPGQRANAYNVATEEWIRVTLDEFHQVQPWLDSDSIIYFKATNLASEIPRGIYRFNLSAGTENLLLGAYPDGDYAIQPFPEFDSGRVVFELLGTKNHADGYLNSDPANLAWMEINT